MIYVTNTPNYAGVAVCGDNRDMEAFYESLHTVTGEEGEYPAYELPRLRVLGFCYDIRHALMGDREVIFEDNGLDQDMMKRMSVVANDKNVYLKVHALWPEILFVTMVLNDFIMLYARKQAKIKYDVMLDRKNVWDPSIAQVRVFQAALASCIKETVTPHSFTRVMNLMNRDYTWFNGYVTHYLDILNCRFVSMDREKRLKGIPTMAKRIVEQGEEYQREKQEVLAAAEYYNTSVDNIKPYLDYPEEIDW